MKNQQLIEKISGKSILFIAPKFYHYNSEMVRKMESYGAEVTFFYERDVSILHAIIDAFVKSLQEFWKDRHYRNILKEIKTKHFDYLFVINGSGLKGWFVEGVKRLNPNIKTIMYQWDSRQNREYFSKIQYFDKTMSFDFADARELSLKYVPTFHVDEFSNLPEGKLKYDLFFYGNFTWERYEKMIELKNYANELGLSIHTHLFISWKRYLMERLKGVPILAKNVSFKRMTKESYLKLFTESRIIVDLTTNTQTGIAMRVLDALGAGKKIITNNPHIINEPSYNKEQILIIDPENFYFPKEFLEPKSFPKHDYTIDKWLAGIFID